MDLTAQTKTSSQRYPLMSYWENTFHDITGERRIRKLFHGLHSHVPISELEYSNASVFSTGLATADTNF